MGKIGKRMDENNKKNGNAMVKKKSSSSFLNIVAAIVYQVIAIIGGFIVPGLILSTYGASIHGYTSTVSNIIGYVSLVTAGLAPAAVQAYYEALVKRDNRLISCVYNTVSRLYNKAGVLYFVSLFIVGIILQFFLCNQLSVIYIYALLFSSGLNGVIECFSYSRSRVLLLADQSLYYVIFVDSAAYLIRVILQVILIANSGSIILVMLIPTILAQLRAVCLQRIIRKRYQIDESVPPDDRLLAKRYHAFVHQITGLIVLNTDVVLLTIVGNLTQVSQYAIYNLVFTSFYSLLTNMFKNGTVASFGRLLFEKKDRLKYVFSQFEFIYYIVVAIIYSCCGVLIMPFVRLYTAGQEVKYDNSVIAILFLVIGILNNIRVPADTLITAAGHFKETQWRAILEAGINLFVSILLIKPFGIVGILLGTVISFTYRSVDIVIYTYKKILHERMTKCFIRIVRMLFIVSVCIFVCSIAVHYVTINNWTRWFGASIITGIISMLLSVGINFIYEPKLLRDIVRDYILNENPNPSVMLDGRGM